MKSLIGRRVMPVSGFPSTFVREVLMIRAHGIDMVRSLYERRLRLVAGMSDEFQGDA